MMIGTGQIHFKISVLQGCEIAQTDLDSKGDAV